MIVILGGKTKPKTCCSESEINPCGQILNETLLEKAEESSG